VAATLTLTTWYLLPMVVEASVRQRHGRSFISCSSAVSVPRYVVAHMHVAMCFHSMLLVLNFHSIHSIESNSNFHVDSRQQLKSRRLPMPRWRAIARAMRRDSRPPRAPAPPAGPRGDGKRFGRAHFVTIPAVFPCLHYIGEAYHNFHYAPIIGVEWVVGAHGQVRE